MPNPSASKGSRFQGTRLPTLDFNEGARRPSQVPTTLVSRTEKATFLVFTE